MAKMTLEAARAELEKLLNYRDPLGEAFHGGRVGFRRDRKKVEREIDRSLARAKRMGELRDFIDAEERKAARAAEPVKPSPYYSTPDELEVGGRYVDCFYGTVTIKRRNKNTVTIQTASGYTEARKPSFIYRKKQDNGTAK